MKISFNSPVVLIFSIICTAIVGLDSISSNLFSSVLAIGGTFQLSNPLFYLNLFSHVLAHADFTHLISNLTFILLLGPLLEEKYGSKNLLYMIIITAFVTGFFNVLFFNTGLIGASGIVFMFIVLISFSNVQAGKIPLTFILIVILYLGTEIFNSFGDDNISQFAHIFGGLCGGVFGLKKVFVKDEESDKDNLTGLDSKNSL